MFVNIKFVNLPGPQSSGKYGSIVTPEGTKVMVPADMLGMFRSGMACEIATKEQQWGANTVLVATSGPGGVSQGLQGRTGYQAGNAGQGAQRSNTGFQPRVVQGGAGQQIGSNPGVDQGRSIFACGVVQRAMQTGKFAASEILTLTQAACEAYDRVVAAPATPPGRQAEPDANAGTNYDPNLNDTVQDL